MTIHPVGPSDIEQFTLTMHPSRTFTSSSQSGITGSVHLFARRSSIEKEVQPLSAFLDAEYNDQDLQRILDGAIQASVTSSNISAQMQSYLAGVNAQSASPRKQKFLEVIRFEPSFSFTSDTLRKSIVVDSLIPYYKNAYPTSQYAYTNYHTLNFFTSSATPSDTVLLYPNSASAMDTAAASGSYVLKGPFTFEFYINPRYTTDSPHDAFKAGTILHLSSSYAVSLVTGSLVDLTDRPAGFRIVLQCSHSADVAPSMINLSSLASGSGRRDLIFASNDNSLLLNHWHHVAIRWGTNALNRGTGSFVIDGVEQGTFVIPSSTVAPLPYAPPRGNPDVLCVGNYYEGTNSGSDITSLFFNQNVSAREGLVNLVNTGDPSDDVPLRFRFAHPLNAEIHNLRIHDQYLSIDEIISSSQWGSTETGSLIFYVPPFFTRESPNRQEFGSDGLGNPIGGILQTPFFTVDGTTIDPFNVAMSFGVGGHLLNLENFAREFIQGTYPRLLHLSATQLSGDTELLTMNQFLYATGSVAKRNVTVLPCDNGLFMPDFHVLASGSLVDTPDSGTLLDKYVNDMGNLDLSLITLRNLFPTAALFSGIHVDSGAFFDTLAGASPENIGIAPGEVYTIFQRTRDNTSNEVVFFDISNMFYGNRIKPGSLVLQDPAITGSGGKIGITLKDDGYGNLYRADAKTVPATWASVGNVFYDEGIVVVKSPNIPLFGTDQFSITFQGTQNAHILRIHTLVRAGEVNSSSNPNWQLVSASLRANETDEGFVYITGLNFHDDNLNVVMKAKYAQPILKRDSDRYLLRTKMDY